MAEPYGRILGLRCIADAFDVVLCDVFGVLHDEQGPFPAATAALDGFRASGGTVVLVSNSAEPAVRLVRSLADRGVAASHDDAVSSADVARRILRERDPRTVLHIGPIRDRALFDGLAVSLTDDGSPELIVCTGYPEPDDKLEATLALGLRRGCLMLCTNPDTSLVVHGRVLRFAGLVAGRYRAIGGDVLETGKPGALIYGHALGRAAVARGHATPPARILGIGDTFALDVMGALGQGFAALHIGNAPSATDPIDRLHRMSQLAW